MESSVTVACLAAIKNILNAVPKLLDFFRNKDVPRKAIVIINSDSGYENFWSIAREQEKAKLQIVCNFMVTNITEHPVALARAFLKGIKGRLDFVDVNVKDVNSRYSGSYSIPPKMQTKVQICFLFNPKKIPERGKSIELKVGVVDQYGNTSYVKNVLFRSA